MIALIDSIDKEQALSIKPDSKQCAQCHFTIRSYPFLLFHTLVLCRTCMKLSLDELTAIIGAIESEDAMKDIGGPDY